MVGMHDAPLISPENKDSDRDTFAGLPKVTLHEHVPSDAATPADLTAATAAAVAALAADNVVYAELRLHAETYPFSAQEAVDAALAGLDHVGLDARLVIMGLRGSTTLQELAALTVAAARKDKADRGSDGSRIVGFALGGDVAQPLPDVDALVATLRRGFLPFELHADGEIDDVAAGVQAGVNRLSHATALVDDFTANLDGIAPGEVSGWVCDRRIPVIFSPAVEIMRGQLEELSDHPLPLLQQLGFTCTISAGPPEVGTLTDQFVALNETLSYGLEEFFDLTVKAVENAFAPQVVREKLLETTILPAYEELGDPEFAEDALFRGEDADAASDHDHGHDHHDHGHTH